MSTPPAVASPARPATRPLYWSVRRELWENRSVYLAPLAVAAVVLFGFLIHTITLSRRMSALAALDAAKQREAVQMPYNIAAGLVLLTAFIVGVFYCLDALHGERRDRSILFWKSLPVSDLTTVLAKASIPLLVLPLVVFPIVIAARLAILLLSNLVLLGNGAALAMLWTHVKFFQSSLAMLYGVIVIALWHAPIYAWLLMVSAWARRTTLLWAVLPPLALCVFEHIAFSSKHLASALGYRFVGGLSRAFVFPPKGSGPIDPLAAIAPGRFLATPGLWLGLALAAVFLAAAVRLRRHREPI
jgi:ABC-2 type transport system permease protein